MTIQSRTTLKGYFDTGDTITTTAMNDVIDSFLHLSDTTAQSLNSDLNVPNLVATNVSANNTGITGTLRASAAVFTGAVRQGVSAAASAANSLGYFPVVQESTVAGAATAQVGFLPSTSNIIGFRAKVLVNGSAAAGGVRINVGNSDARNFFGTITVSAGGLFDFTAVSAVRLAGVSGRVEMVCSAASANTNVVGMVIYHQRA